MFSFAKIKGGIHPDENKHLSNHKPIAKALLPDHVIIPLSQHLGAPANPIVKVGDSVKTGQVIAEAGGFVSAYIHSSVSGEVKDIGEYPVPHASGLKNLCIKIKRHGDEWHYLPRLSLESSADILIERLREAGLTGMGGASFPSNIKYLAKDKIHTLIVNAAECEPYITADDMLMRERAEQIISGIKIAQKILKPKSVIIGVEDNKTEAIKILKKALAKENGDKSSGIRRVWPLANSTTFYENLQISLAVVPTKYPTGGEKQLIQVLTGVEVPSGELPSSVGFLCQNIATVAAISDAVLEGMPLVKRIVTVTGRAVNSPGNFEARLGTPLSELLDQAGADQDKVSRLIAGGPMMGQVMKTTDVPLVKGCGGILALNEQEIPQAESSPCVKCGKCVNACPMGLVPLEMARHTKYKDYDGAVDFGLTDCILCGSCAYVCPSHLPLVQYFQFAKGELKKQSDQDRRLDYTRQLSEVKRARLKKEADAKAAAKAAKAKKRKRTTNPA